MFKLENLPKDVKEKIYNITFTPDESFMGFVNLVDDWCFEWDGSHTENFTDRNDLIDIVRNWTKRC